MTGKGRGALAAHLLLALSLAGCKSIPDSYAPPMQRNPLTAPDESALRPFVSMSDPDLRAHVVRDISDALEAGTWRWAREHPELKFALSSARNQKLRVDFAIPGATFRKTGPVTVTFAVNGNLLDKVRYDAPGEKRFEKPVPAAWLRTDQPNLVLAEADKTWAPPQGGVRLAYILIRAGFVE